MTEPILSNTGVIMASVQITVVTTKADLPANTTQAGIKVTLTDSSGNSQSATATNTSSPPYTVTFDNVSAGKGSLQADWVDGSGTVIAGGSITGDFDTGGGTTTTQGDAPSAFTVTVS